MIKKFLFKIIISAFFTLIPIPIGFLLQTLTPDVKIPLFMIFLLPVLLFAVNLLCIFITLHDNSKNTQSNKILNIIFYLMPFTSIFASGITFCVALGANEKIIMIFTNLFLALTLFVIGNYMPKCRHNHTIGVRIPWTLGSEENWSATHRFAGKCAIIAAFISIICAFLPIWAFFANFVSIMLFVALLPSLYSYRYYKKHKTEKGAVINKKAGIASIVTGVAILIILVAICFTGNIDVEFSEESFTVKADYWNDFILDYSNIEEIEYREDFDAGRRVMGFGSPRLLMGNFRNREFSNYTIFSYTKSPAHLVIKTENKIIVIGLEKEEDTKELYELIVSKTK